MGNKVLYWPGRGQNLDILSDFRRSLEACGAEIECIGFSYDCGPLSPQTWTEVRDNHAEWWIGLSLGASLACYSLLFASVKPKRLTLINPFFSREQLSSEKHFSLDGQWKFSLNGINEFVDLEIVVSIHDDKIPLHHSFDILRQNSFSNAKMIFVDDNHTIDDSLAQRELASVLLGRNHGKSRYSYFFDSGRVA